MIPLVVGGDGLIGGALKSFFEPDVIATSRRQNDSSSVFLDLMLPPDQLMTADVAYFCAGVNGIRENEGNAIAWRTNVDGTIAVIKLVPEAFVVYLSSNAVEWSDTSYARQRGAVELFLQTRGRAAIVRVQKVTKDNVAQFVLFLVKIGQKQRDGVYHWP